MMNRSCQTAYGMMALSLPALIFINTGCRCKNKDDTLKTSADRTRAILTAARVHNVGFFGEPPIASDPSYFDRPLVSAVQYTYTEDGADFDVDVGPSGDRLFFASTRHSLKPDLFWKSVDGVAVTQLTTDPASDIQPACSPDGTKVAFASDRSGNWDIWTMDVNGGPAVQVTRGVADDIHPSWSPDASKLVYGSLPADGGPGELWIADAVAGGTSRFIGYGLFPDWSPTEDLIVYQRARERGSRWFSVWTVQLADGEPRYPTELAADASQAMFQPSFSLDGRRIAFVGTASMPNPSGERVTETTPEYAYDIWVMNNDGRNRVRLTDGFAANYAPAFAPDGRVFFTSNRNGYENLWSMATQNVENTSGNAITIRSQPGSVARTAADGGGGL